MKYFIELGVRSNGVQLIKLTEDEKNELLNEDDLDDIYYDWVEKIDYDFELENYYLTPESDRYTLTIRDENDNIVYESDDVQDLEDRTFDENGNIQVKGWKFEGVKDGYYLTRCQVIKGCWCTGEFELNEPFDKNKLYVIQDKQIDEDLLGDLVYPLFDLYYQNGEGYDISRDKIKLDLEEDCGEQYYETLLCMMDDGCCWTNLREELE
jgi:hypothetical protein